MISKRRLTIKQKLHRFAVFSEASLLLSISRLLILFVPFRLWRKSLGMERADVQIDTEATITDEAVIVRAKAIGKQVRGAAVRLPFRAVCLPQAMTARWMLARRGIKTRLFIGARAVDGPTSHAFHAWLMLGSVCITGQHEMEQFQAFSTRNREVRNGG